MRRIAVAAVALSLLGGTSAFAQPDDHHHDQDKGGAPHESSAPHAPPGGAPHGPPGGGAPHGAPTFSGRSHGPIAPQGPAAGPVQSYGQSGANHRHEGPVNPGGPNYHPTGPAPTFHAPAGGYHPGFGAPGVRPGGAQPRYNPQHFPHVYNTGHRFHWRSGGWSNQPGYYTRSWAYGDHLPRGWFAAQWWIDNYWLYDLPVPPYGYEWVRVGPDALLVDLSDGEVVEVVPALFF